MVASRYNINPNMLSAWRKQFLVNAADIIDGEEEKAAQAKQLAAHESEVDDLNRIIAEITVERDYLQRRVREIIGGRGRWVDNVYCERL